MRFRKKGLFKKIVSLVLFIIFLSLVSSGVNFGVYKEIQKRLSVQIEGRYIPNFFTPSFELRKGSFIWESKLQLIEGDFKVTFDPISLLTSQGIRIIVTSGGSRVKLLGDWAIQEGIEDAVVDSLVADIVLGRRGLASVNEVEVASKSFQFSLKNADKKLT